MVINRIDIEECKDIDKLRDLTLVQFDFISKVNMALESMVNDGLNHKECVSDIMGYVYDYNIALTDMDELNPKINVNIDRNDLSADEITRMLSALSEIATKHSTDDMRDNINNMRNEIIKNHNVYSASDKEIDNIEAVGMLHALSIVNKYFPGDE